MRIEMSGQKFGSLTVLKKDKLGVISAVTRITDKVNRLQSLCVRAAQVSDESVRDTLLDLANYAIMSVIELERSNLSETEGNTE